MYIFILFLAGLFQGIMVSFNGQLSNYFNTFEVTFFVHLAGVVMVLCYALFIEKKRPKLTGAPPHVYTVGLFGLTVVSLGAVCSAHIGATATLAVSVTGQMIMSACVDHFGWFHREKVLFHAKQLPGILIALAGVMLIVYG